MYSDPFVMLVKVICNLYLFIVLLRLVLQLTRADFYNPISQGIVKATSPIVLPLRKVIPAIGRLDTASLVLALAVQLLTVFFIVMIKGVAISPITYQLCYLYVCWHLVSFVRFVFLGDAYFGYFKLGSARCKSPGSYVSRANYCSFISCLPASYSNFRWARFITNFYIPCDFFFETSTSTL